MRKGEIGSHLVLCTGAGRAHETGPGDSRDTRIRHYGFLANRCCKRKLACVRAALAWDEGPRSRKGPNRPSGPVELTCRVCGKERLMTKSDSRRSGPGGVDRPGSCLVRPDAGRRNANEDEPGEGPRPARCWNPGSESGTFRPGTPFEARGNVQNERETPIIRPDSSGNRHRCGRLENTITYR